MLMYPNLKRCTIKMHACIENCCFIRFHAFNTILYVRTRMHDSSAGGDLKRHHLGREGSDQVVSVNFLTLSHNSQ